MSDTCASIQEILSAQLDGESTVSEDQMASFHLEACTNCQAYSDMLEDLSFTLLREADGPEGVEESPDLSTLILPATAPGPMLVLDTKLWLLLLIPSLNTALGTAATLTQSGASAASTLGPAAGFLILSPLLARSDRASTWTRLRPLVLLALLSPFLGPQANLALLLLMAWAARTPRPPARFERPFLLWGLTSMIVGELLLRSTDLLQTLLPLAVSLGAEWPLQLLTGSLLLLCWLIAFGRSRVSLVLTTLASLALACNAAAPVLDDYQAYQQQVQKLPPPRSQYWYVCLRMGPHMEIRTGHFERWSHFQKTLPETRAVIQGQLGSWEGTVDSRGIVALPWPDVTHRFDAVPTATVRKSFENVFAETDRAVAQRLDGSFSGYLATKHKAAPLTYDVIHGYDFQLPVPPGDYTLAFERKPNELLRRYAAWHKVKAQGKVDLEEGNYWPEVVYEGPTNLDFSQGLEGWEDNEVATVVPGRGLEIASPRTVNRQQGIKQKFLPRSIGGDSVDEVRVTVWLSEPSPQGQLKLSSETLAGDYQQEQAPTTEQRTSLTYPVSRDLRFLEISLEFTAPGAPLRVQSFQVEGLARGKVLRTMGGQP